MQKITKENQKELTKKVIMNAASHKNIAYLFLQHGIYCLRTDATIQILLLFCMQTEKKREREKNDVEVDVGCYCKREREERN